MSIYKRIVKDKFDRDLSTDTRGLYALIQSEICIDGKPMEDDEAIKVLNSMVKTCNKNIDLYKHAGKVGMSLEEAVFRGMIQSYLPAGCVQEDVEMGLAILDLPRTMKSMGPLMKHLKEHFQVVDGNLVKSILMGKQ